MEGGLKSGRASEPACAFLPPACPPSRARRRSLAEVGLSVEGEQVQPLDALIDAAGVNTVTSKLAVDLRGTRMGCRVRVWVMSGWRLVRWPCGARVGLEVTPAEQPRRPSGVADRRISGEGGGRTGRRVLTHVAAPHAVPVCMLVAGSMNGLEQLASRGVGAVTQAGSANLGSFLLRRARCLLGACLKRQGVA